MKAERIFKIIIILVITIFGGLSVLPVLGHAVIFSIIFIGLLISMATLYLSKDLIFKSKKVDKIE